MFERITKFYSQNFTLSEVATRLVATGILPDVKSALACLESMPVGEVLTSGQAVYKRVE